MKRNRQGTGGEEGFTIIEVVLALVVLAVVVLGYMASQNAAVALERDTQDRELALNAAVRRLEALKTLSLGDLEALDGSGFAVAGLNPPAGDADGLPGLVRVEMLSPVLARVTVRVEWQGAGGTRSQEIGTLISAYR